MRRFYRPADRAGPALDAAIAGGATRSPRATPVELDPPDLSPWRAGNTGIDYVTSFAASAPGPHVMLSALVHGNEICGAIALDRLLREGLRPARGRLTFAFANIAAYRSFSRLDPAASRYVDEDMNRIWDAGALDGARLSRELARARALRPLVDTVDYLLDIHSTTNLNPPMMLTGLEQKHLDFAKRIGFPALLVRDGGHEGGRRLRDYGRFADPASPTIALLVESGQHWAKPTADTATEMTGRFLAATGTLTEADAAPFRALPREPQRVIQVTERVTIQSDDFRFFEAYEGFEVIPRAGTAIARDDGRDIRTPYDDCVLVMPSRRFSRGQTAVRLGRFED
ncbi:MAG TPA: succinylglutamate desuccinylase/aspartoacylase family protein [Stellaceae bacterium]|jgi:predicted deacylase